MGGRRGEKVAQRRWSRCSIPSKPGPWAETINITSQSQFTTPKNTTSSSVKSSVSGVSVHLRSQWPDEHVWSNLEEPWKNKQTHRDTGSRLFLILFTLCSTTRGADEDDVPDAFHATH